jgi:hypothetical protein
LNLRYEILEKRKDSIEAKRDVSISLEILAGVYTKQGDVVSALDNFKKSLNLRYEILEKRKDSLEAQRDLCIGLINIANEDLYKNIKNQQLKYLTEAKEIANNNMGKYDFDELSLLIDKRLDLVS